MSADVTIREQAGEALAEAVKAFLACGLNPDKLTARLIEQLREALARWEQAKGGG